MRCSLPFQTAKYEVVGRGEKLFARCVGARHASPVIAAGSHVSSRYVLSRDPEGFERRCKAGYEMA